MYEKLSKNALKCMYISAVVGMLFVLIVATVLEILLFIPNDWVIAHILVAFVCGVMLLNTIISPWFRYNRYRYKIDDECIDIEEGYIFVERNIVPIERLHKLQVNRGPIDKLCGVAKVNVTTAGGDVTIRFLDEERANVITDGLKKRINEIVAKQKAEAQEENVGEVQDTDVTVEVEENASNVQNTKDAE